MAQTATLYNYTIQLADMDRGVYADFELRVARQPSETAEFMLLRVLAYCLEYGEGIELTEGVAAVDEPAVQIRDLTGRVTAWIEVGAPDAERDYVRRYLRVSGSDAAWDFLRAAYGSASRLAIVPMQDLWGLGSVARFNTPSKAEGNWQWRYRADALERFFGGTSDYLRELTVLFGR